MIAESSCNAPIDTADMLFVCGMSRSGTTLLATVFDSHSRISLGYELIPPPKCDLVDLAKSLDEGLALAKGQFDLCGAALRESGDRAAASFFARCSRAGLDADQTRHVLAQLRNRGITLVETLKQRLEVAWQLARERHLDVGTDLFGFKLNIPSVAAAHECFPGGFYVFIVRDPRDVAASHRVRGFDRTLEQIVAAWNNYVTSFERFRQQWPERAVVIRYEDLVGCPHDTIEDLFGMLPVSVEPSVFQFHRSNAAVHRGGHPNAGELKQGFFTTSVRRWEHELSSADVRDITRHCKSSMDEHGYK